MRAVDDELFGALCKELILEVTRSGEPIFITRDGLPITRLEPIKPKPPSKTLWGVHKGQIEILGDIIAPIDSDRESNS